MLFSALLPIAVLGLSSMTCTQAATIPVVLPRTSQDDIKQYLDNHNSVRSQHGASALTWNDTLSAFAEKTADTCKFAHSGGPYGENLAAGTGNYDIAAGIKSWANEAKNYSANNPGFSEDTGHFTQMVWKATKQVGCAVKQCDGIFPASYGKASFYVCEYYPRGNVIGEFPQNVQM